jgi:hypothetical protein
MRLTVHDPAQCVHEAIAEAFGCGRRRQVQRVMFGDDTDVLESESLRSTASRWVALDCKCPCLVSQQLGNACVRLPVPRCNAVYSAVGLRLQSGRGEAQRDH